MYEYYNPVPGSPDYDWQKDMEDEEKMSKLYELSGQYNKLWNMVDEEADLQMIEDTLQGLEGDIEDKVDGIVKTMLSIETDELGIKAEEERLYSRRQALQNRRESIKRYLEGNLIAVGIDKLKTPLFTVSIQSNPPSVNIQDNVTVPEKYYLPQPPKLDRKSLLADLKSGTEYDGISIQQTKSIRIR